MSKQNVFDDEIFFSGYKALQKNQSNANVLVVKDINRNKCMDK